MTVTYSEYCIHVISCIADRPRAGPLAGTSHPSQLVIERASYGFFAAGTCHMAEPDLVIDACGLICPLPVLRARKGLAGLKPGGLLRLLSTDPASVQDMAAFCAQPGKELVASGRDGDVYTFLVRRTE